MMMSEALKLRYNITEWERWGLNYVGIPKCGNTMFKWYLLGCPPIQNMADSNAEIHQEHRARYITPEQANANGYRTVALIRNPLERVFSMWRDFHGKRNGLLGQRDMNLYEFIEKVVVPSDDTENTNVHLRSMHYFIKDIKNPWLILLDDINHQEGEELRELFGVDKFESVNTTEHMHSDEGLENAPDTWTAIRNFEIEDMITTRYPEDWELYKKLKLPPSFRAC